MAAGTRVVLNHEGLDELLGAQAGPIGRDLLRRAISVENQAKQLCPVDTGRLRSSIAHAMRGRGGSLSAIVGTNVTYSVFVELGTRHMSAQPYLRPALSAAQ